MSKKIGVFKKVSFVLGIATLMLGLLPLASFSGLDVFAGEIENPETEEPCCTVEGTPSTPISEEQEVTPIIIPGQPGGNRSCEDLGTCDFDNTSGRIDFIYDEENDTYTWEDEDGNPFDFQSIGITVTVTDGKFVSFIAEFGIGAVIVKGGPNANIYLYDPSVQSDSGLAAPLNPGGKRPELSNLTFCWYDPELDPDPCDCDELSLFSNGNGCECNGPEDPPGDPETPGGGGGITALSVPLLIPVTGVDQQLAALQAVLRSLGMAFVGASILSGGIQRRIKN